ncbi:MAG TPA: hypothetical protein VI457_09065 [Methylococcaceae bacterium]|nr:hypothetical protein [Methylococcaceae bacterium]
MPTISCPACAARISDQAATCSQCGRPLGSAAPIRRVGGKLQAAATLLLALGAVATVFGGWWGPALLFPGIVIFALGHFFEDERQ